MDLPAPTITAGERLILNEIEVIKRRLSLIEGPAKGFIPLKKACDLYDTNRETIRRLVKAGKIERAPGRLVRLRRADLDRVFCGVISDL